MYIRFEDLPKWAQKILWETHFYKPSKVKMVVSEQVKIGFNEVKSTNQFLYGFNGKKIRKIKSATFESYAKAPDVSRALFIYIQRMCKLLKNKKQQMKRN